jgi:hypothetical protein
MAYCSVFENKLLIITRFVHDAVPHPWFSAGRAVSSVPGVVSIKWSIAYTIGYRPRLYEDHVRKMYFLPELLRCLDGVYNSRLQSITPCIWIGYPNHDEPWPALLLLMQTILDYLTNDCAVYGGTSGGESKSSSKFEKNIIKMIYLCLRISLLMSCSIWGRARKLEGWLEVSLLLL